MEGGYPIDYIPEAIDRGIRFILKNTFIHFVTEGKQFPARETASRRTLSAPPSTGYSELSGSTLMVKNIPTRFSQETFLKSIEVRFDITRIDFFYLPLDFKSGKSLGYAFVNFVSSEALNDFYRKFSRVKLCSSSSKCLALTLAKIQGLDNNYNLFKTSSVMTYAPPEFRPMIQCSSCGILRPLSSDGEDTSVFCSSQSCAPM